MIFVTGGAGFIGSHFIEAWLADPPEPVLNLDALTHAGQRRNLEVIERLPAARAAYRFVEGNLADRALLDRLLAEYRPRAVINFAAETHVDRAIANPAPFFHSNLLGTFTLLEALRAYREHARDASSTCGSELARDVLLVQVSTDEVYGARLPGEAPVAEGAAYAPTNPYSATKAGADHLVRAWHHTYGLPTIITACSNNYGPRQYPEKLLPLMLERARAGEPLPVYGDGLQRREWLHVRDHVRGLRRVLEAGVPGATYHFAGAAECTNLELVQTLCRLLDAHRPRPDGRSYLEQITHVADRPGHDRRYSLDGTRAARELGWRPEITLAEGLAELVGAE